MFEIRKSIKEIISPTIDCPERSQQLPEGESLVRVRTSAEARVRMRVRCRDGTGTGYRPVRSGPVRSGPVPVWISDRPVCR